jgi:hypothetical protein
MTFFAQFTEGVTGTPSNDFYRKNKKSGGYRLIGAPNEPMLKIQHRIKKFLEKIAPRFYNATASKGGLGAVRNARSHTEKNPYGLIGEFVFKIDLAHAFDSVNVHRLVEAIAKRARVFISRNEHRPTKEEWFEFLAPHCFTRRGGLIQGAATSQLLLDWYCELFLDKPIREYFRRLKAWTGLDVHYTRYVDDLTISSSGGHRYSKVIKISIRRLVAEAGFLENHKKTAIAYFSSDKMGPHVLGGETMRITGPRIGARHLALPRKEVKKMERMLDAELHTSLFSTQVVVKPETIEGKLRYLLEVLRGKKKMNKLEERTLKLYQKWCQKTGRDEGWVRKTLASKSPRKSRKKNLGVTATP